MSSTILTDIAVICDKCNLYEYYDFEADVIMQDGKPVLLYHDIKGEHTCDPTQHTVISKEDV